MYKLIVKYEGYSNNKDSGVWDVVEGDDEFLVKLNVAFYPNYKKFSGKFLKFSFFIEKDGVEEEIDYQNTLDLWGDLKLVG